MKQRLLILAFSTLIVYLPIFAMVALGGNAPNNPEEQTLGVSPPPDTETGNIGSRNTAIATWLHMLDKEVDGDNSGVLAFAPQVPGDLARALRSAGGERGAKGLVYVFFISLISIAVGFLLVFGVKNIAKKTISRLEQTIPPDDESLSCFWAGLLRSLPALISIVLLAFSSTLVFLLFSGNMTIEARMLFQLMLGSVLVFKTSSMLSQVVFSPEDDKVRPLDLTDSIAKSLHRAFISSISFILSGFLFVNFIRDLGVQEQTVAWTFLLIGTAMFSLFGFLVLYLKTPISNSLQMGIDGDDSNWIKNQLAAYWHVPALFYIFFAWFIWSGQEISGTAERDGSFAISLFIVPIYIALSYTGHAVIRSVVDSIGLESKIDLKNSAEGEEEANELEALTSKKAIVSKSYVVYRIILATALVTWTMSLWGYKLPFATNAIKTIFQSLITLALALTLWRFASAFIERKIEEAAPDIPEDAEDGDNEFGGAVAAGRSHTLLPMLRKVLGTILVTMVILVMISSLGVNIAPLLAGAGVLGLAVGFGAQKLVSDVLSGFFFLLDDAFRVGEYIQTGSIKGTVEVITLRNVMLRHHRGMLQVVPHSDLGAVTNYMRGGIVVKFPLEFPYDTDIDKVRKIIKKVGQAMLLDEELKDDFIQPVKSQGVNQISNSVMTIRVKFTAKPGTQFVIKREAFRRLTEAFNSKGIYYAHRKVIVDFPDNEEQGTAIEETRKKALEAGAASVVAAESDQPIETEKKFE